MATSVVTAANLAISDFELGTRVANKVTLVRATVSKQGVASFAEQAEQTKLIFASSLTPLPFNIAGNAATATLAHRALAVNYADVTGAPSRLSDLSNDTGFVTNTQLATVITQIGGIYTPDPTVPPTPTNTQVTAGLTFFIIKTDNPTYTVGHGHGYLRVYATLWPTGVVAQPMFSETFLRVRVSGSLGEFSAAVGERWVIWTKWESVDAGVSGASAAFVATTGTLNGVDLNGLIIQSTQLANGSVTATKLADQAVTLTKFANGIEPVTVIQSGLVPTSYVTSMVLVNGKSYRWDSTAGAYVSGVPAVDIGGQLISTQIADAAIQANNLADGSVNTRVLAAGSVTASKMVVTDLTNLVLNPTGATTDGWIPLGAETFSLPTVSPWLGAVTGATTFWAARGVQSDTGFVFAARDTFFGQWFDVDPLDEFWVSAAVGPTDNMLNDYGCAFGLILSNAAHSVYWFINQPSVGNAAQVINGSIKVPNVVGIVKARVWFQVNAPFDLENAQHYYTSATKARWSATKLVLRRKNNANLIVDGSITATKLAALSVSAVNMQADSIAANHLQSGSVTAGKLSVDAVTAGTIGAGAVNTRELAAGAVTVDRLLVTGRGNALNTDPYFKDHTAWRHGDHGPQPSFVNLAAATDGRVGTTAVLADGVQASIQGTQPIEVIPGKTYLISVLMYGSGSAEVGGSYLRACAVDATGAQINQYALSSSMENFVVPRDGIWHRYSTEITAASVGGANYMVPRLIMNYTPGPSGQVFAQELMIQEKIAADLIVDGAILAKHLSAGSIAVGSAAIANGAITNAMLGTAIIDTANIRTGAINNAHIGDAQITSAKIGDLDASKITTGVLAAERIGANTITTNKMVVTGRGAALNADPLFTDPTAYLYGNAGTWGPATRLAVNQFSYAGNFLFRGQGTGVKVECAELIGVSPSKVYRVSFAYRGADGANGTIGVRIVGHDGAGAALGDAWLQDFPSNPDTQWRRYTSPNISGFTIPQVRLTVYANYASTAGFVDIQDLRFEEMVGADLLVNGCITADSAAVASLNADKITAGTISSARFNVGEILNIGANNATVQGTNVTLSKYGLVIRDDSGNVRVKLGNINLL